MITGQSGRVTRVGKRLRQQMTDAEKILWDALRDRHNGAKWRRQVPVGSFVADFCCCKHKLLVELDGGIHTAMTERDKDRDEQLKAIGWKVLRIKNNDVLESLPHVLNQLSILTNP